MKALLVLMLLILSGSGFSGDEVLDLPAYQQKVKTYVTSGDYDKDIVRVLEKWVHLLPEDAATVAKPAIVLDVDETALSNWPEMKRTNFGYAFCSWEDWVRQANALALAPVQRLYKTALAHGVTVFFITGRRERLREATAENLKKAGYVTYQALICKPDDYKGDSAHYKAAERQKIIEQGYQILLNVGDQQSDLSGGFADAAVKLPNPFYTLD